MGGRWMDGQMGEQTSIRTSAQVGEQVGGRTDRGVDGFDPEETIGRAASNTHSMTFFLHRLLSLGW